MPLHRFAFEIPEKYRTVDNGEQFLVYDGGIENVSRMSIFATQRYIDVPCSSAHWFMGGTLMENLKCARKYSASWIQLMHFRANYSICVRVLAR